MSPFAGQKRGSSAQQRWGRWGRCDGKGLNFPGPQSAWVQKQRRAAERLPSVGVKGPTPRSYWSTIENFAMAFIPDWAT